MSGGYTPGSMSPSKACPTVSHVVLFGGAEQRRYAGTRIVGAVGAVRVVGVAVARGDALLAAVEGLPPSADAAEARGADDSRGGSMNQPLGFRVQIPVHTLGGGPLPGFECCGVAVQRGNPLSRVEGVPPAHGHGNVRGIDAEIHASEQGQSDRVHTGLFGGGEQRRPAGAGVVGTVPVVRNFGVAVADGNALQAAVEGSPPSADAGELYVPVDRTRGVVDKDLGCHVQVGVRVLGGSGLLGSRFVVAVQGGQPLFRVEGIPPAHGRRIVGGGLCRRIFSLPASLTRKAEGKSDKQRENHEAKQRFEPLSVAVSRSLTCQCVDLQRRLVGVGQSMKLPSTSGRLPCSPGMFPCSSGNRTLTASAPDSPVHHGTMFFILQVRPRWRSSSSKIW